MSNFDKALDIVNQLLIQEGYNEHLIVQGYYLKSKLMIEKQDFKSAVINLNNAQIINDRLVKVRVASLKCIVVCQESAVLQGPQSREESS